MSVVAHELNAGFRILWYEIEKVLGRGGFGITYQALDTNLGRRVAIKEYLPREFAARGGDSTVQPISEDLDDVYSWGLERFMIEAQTLAKFEHPNIVRVLSVFEHNNTGYMVMEFEEGDPLSRLYQEGRIKGQEKLLAIFEPIIEGLAIVHAGGFIHRDIKPDNIFVRADSSPVLIDFGAARQAIGTKTRTMTAMLSLGYAPFEQYNEGGGKQGPWTDIYALGASMHEGITGKKPTESSIRGIALVHGDRDPYYPLSVMQPPGYSHELLRAIDQALVVPITERPQNLDEFKAMLSGAITLPEIVLPPAAESFAGADQTVVSLRPLGPSSEIQETRIDAKGRAETRQEPGSAAPRSEPPEKAEKTAAAGGGNLPRRRKSFVIPVFLLLLLVGVGSFGYYYYTFQRPEVVRQQRIDTLLEEAASHFAAGRLYDEQSDNAYRSYVAVLELDPGNDSALNGVANIVSGILQNATAQMQAGQLYSGSGDSAYRQFQTALKVDPENAAARQGIAQIVDRFLQGANERLEAGDPYGAAENIRIVQTIDPENPGLKKPLARLEAVYQQAQRQDKMAGLLEAAGKALAADRLTTPQGDNAVYFYRKAVELDPDNPSVGQIRSSLVGALANRAEIALGNDDWPQARNTIDTLASIAPADPRIKRLENTLSRELRLNEILAKADRALRERRILRPANDNAVFWYGQALGIDPNNALARNRLDSIAADRAARVGRAIDQENSDSALAELRILRDNFPWYPRLKPLEDRLARLDAEKARQARQARQAKQAEQAEQARSAAQARTIEKPVVSEPVVKPDLPIGIAQDREDDVVVSDIMGGIKFAFEARNLQRLSELASLSGNQAAIYKSIFGLYSSFELELMNYSSSKEKGTAIFKISRLINNDGKLAETNAQWTNLNVTVQKKDGYWQKAVIE